MAEDFGALTNMWMLNPTMFDPTQRSNQFSNFNNAPFPWPPTYNTGVGGPTNAATGQPIRAFQQWQAANPAGMNINQTPAQPQQPPATDAGLQALMAQRNMIAQQNATLQGMPSSLNQGGFGSGNNVMSNTASAQTRDNAIALDQLNRQIPQAQQQQAAPAQAAQAGGAPNNWQAAINALSNPGNPQTLGATVPQVSGYQPAGGVNNAFLQQAQGRPNMNQGFLSALAAIQGRPQQQAAAALPQQQPRRWG